MACRRVLHDLRSARMQGSPADPKPDNDAVATEAKAKSWLFQYARPQNVDFDAIVSQLPSHVATYSAALGSDAWLEMFSGKEIFRPLVAWLVRDKAPGGASSLAAAAIGERQREHGSVPGELVTLRDWLLKQVSLPAP